MQHFGTKQVNTMTHFQLLNAIPLQFITGYYFFIQDLQFLIILTGIYQFCDQQQGLNDQGNITACRTSRTFIMRTSFKMKILLIFSVALKYEVIKQQDFKNMHD